MRTSGRKNKKNIGSINQSNVGNVLEKKKQKCNSPKIRICIYARFATKEQAYGDTSR